MVNNEEIHYSSSTPINIDDTPYLVGTRVNKADTLAGDVYMWDKTNNTNFWMRPAVLTENQGFHVFPSSQFEPIAVVAIPASHDVYGTGEVGMVSLNYMRLDAPETGGDYQIIYWGGNFNSLTGLSELNQVPVYNDNVISCLSEWGYNPALASDKYNTNLLDGGGQNTTGGYVDASIRVPSPYTNDGVGRNPEYYSTSVAPLNCFSDFNGKNNTNIITSAAVTEDWEHVSTITNNYDSGSYPAACCCRRYHKGNTKAGDWYLPAAGEGGYLMARYNRINSVLDSLQDFYSQINIFYEDANDGRGTFSTSTILGVRGYLQIYALYGRCNYEKRDYYGSSFVRAFLRA